MKNQSIGKRLLFLILGLSIPLSLLFAVIQGGISYTSKSDAITHGIEKIKQVQINAMTIALWSSDTEQLDALLQGMLNFPYINYVAITGGDQAVIEKGVRKTTSRIDHFPLTYTYNERSLFLGNLEIHTDTVRVASDVAMQIIWVLLFQVLSVLLVAVFIFILFNRLVTAHLVTISGHLASFDSRTIDDPLLLNKKHFNDEIDSLVYSFNRMRENLFHIQQHREEALIALKESEQRIRSISNNLTSGMIYQVVIYPDGTRKFTYLSDSVKELYGISPEEGMADASLIYNKTHKDDIEKMISAENTALQTLSTFKAEIRIHDPSGNIRWSSLVSTPKPMSDGSVCFDGIEFIITDRKNAEEKLIQSLDEKETLIKELFHRTKNTIQIMLSMLTLQAGESPSDPGIQTLANKLKRRIEAISLVHQMLYQSNNLSQISITQYLQSLAVQIMSSCVNASDKITLSVDIEEQIVLIDTAIPLGLILNELLTNSLQHAFPENRKGEIRISIKKISDDAAVFFFSDNGVGVAEDFDFLNQKSLGLKLAYGLGQHQMSGKVTMESNSGVSFSLEFPNNLYALRI